MEKYLEYRKCGDVLVPPSLNYKEQYILKCCECKEYFFIVDAFLDHYLAHACESNEKINSIDFKRKASEEITVTDDPLTTNEDFHDLSDVLKLELDEIAADKVATAPTPNLPKDDNSDTDNNWPECSNDDFNEERYRKD